MQRSCQLIATLVIRYCAACFPFDSELCAYSIIRESYIDASFCIATQQML